MSRVITTLDPELTRLMRRAGPRKIVLLEGVDDLGVFKIWYGKQQDRVAFVATGERFLVEAQTRLAREQGIDGVVFGITDRDYIGEEIWSGEPEPNCFCLHWHELENYLLDPEAIRDELAILNSPEEPPILPEITKWLVQWASDSRSRVAANWMLKPQAKTLLPDGGKEPRPAVVRHLADELGRSEAEVDTLLAAMEAKLAPLLSGLPTLHTVVEGKRLFHLLKQAQFKRFQDGELKNLLARAVAIPPEIQTLLQHNILVR